MAGSTFDPLFSFLKNAQNMLSSGPSSSHPRFDPELKQLNDMVYEVRSPLPEEKPTLEIVFFHGLQQSHSREAYFTTWLSSDNSQLWLQTWLGQAFPKARILTVSYDVTLKTTHDAANLDMYCTAENLISSLTDSDVGVGQAGCPVVLVGHCLGGLVLKELCVQAAHMLSRNSEDRLVGHVSNLLSSLRGMFFYGTPQTGSLLGDELPKHMKSALAKEMETLNNSSARRNEEFDQLKKRYHWLTYGIGEQDPTFLKCLGKSIHVVPDASTRAYMDNFRSIRGDHFNISKPSGPKASGFCALTNFLQQIQEDGVHHIVHNVESQEYYVDLEGRATRVMEMVAQRNIHTTFILGLSGIGKSALAQQVFYNICHSFTVTCFISLDTVDTPGNCRQQIWDKIRASLEGVDGRTWGSHFSLPHYLQSRKVLMVVDNVQTEDQLKALTTSIWLEGTNSKLIVTTTNFRLGTTSNIVAARFEVPYLTEEESHQLFSKYAFGNGEAPLNPLIESVIERCANYPLALKVVGSYAKAEDVHDPRLWQELIGKMDKAVDVDSGPEYRLWATLRVCFNALGPTEQNMFLDAATFFHAVPFSMVECIWADCWEDSFIAWNNLKKRFLANVDKHGKIWMHSQLRVLGQNIACNGTSLGKWTRVYKSQDAMELIANYQGVVDATGLKLQSKLHARLRLAEKTFDAYIHLRYLILEGVEVIGKKLELPTSLVYLGWTNSLFEICPVDFSHSERLVALDLTGCRAMKALPSGLKNASKLRWLELQGCVSLTNSLGIVSRFRHLKRLGLGRIGELATNETQLTLGVQRLCRLEMLVSLDLSETTLRSLPEAFTSLRLLKNLNVSGTNLTSLPESIGELLGLEILDVSDTNLESLPESIGKLTNLRRLFVSFTELRKLPDTIEDLSDLETLDTFHNKNMEHPKSFPKSLKLYNGKATSLPHLAPSKSLLSLVLELPDVEEQSSLALIDPQGPVEIPSFLSTLSLYKTIVSLYLNGVGYAQSLLPQLFCVLQTIPSLENLSLLRFHLVTSMPHELGSLSQLKRLYVDNWEVLKELPESLGNLSMLSVLVLAYLPRLCRLPESLVALSSLSRLDIKRCESLQCMPSSVGHTSSLQRECSTSQHNNSTIPSSSEDPLFSRFHLVTFKTTSWRLLECYFGCCGGQDGCLIVGREEMSELSKQVTRYQERDVLDTKVAVELLREMELNGQGQDSALHEGSGPCTSRPPWRHSPKFKIWCYGPYEIIVSTVPVMDENRESDTEEEEDEEEERRRFGCMIL